MTTATLKKYATYTQDKSESDNNGSENFGTMDEREQDIRGSFTSCIKTQDLY